MTGSQRLRRASWAVGLAWVALALNALLPIHLALDLGEAVGAANRDAAATARHGLEWRLLARVSGHEEGDGKPDGDDRHSSCPAFGALGALGGFATLAPPELPPPAVVEAAPTIAANPDEPERAPPAAYRSRAPPFG